MGQTVNVNFRLDAEDKKKYGASMYRIGTEYECRFYHICKEGRKGT